MEPLVNVLKKQNIELPHQATVLLNSCKSFTVFNSVEELADAAVGGKDSNSFEVTYAVPGKGDVTEVVVHRVKNGISANYTDPYMRRRDPDTMAVADSNVTDKESFHSKYGYEFSNYKMKHLLGYNLKI
jgi:hypothetical protein